MNEIDQFKKDLQDFHELVSHWKKITFNRCVEYSDYIIYYEDDEVTEYCKIKKGA